ncbi:FecR family protein [Pinibacter aurantiacus]|uniref:FecR domain-containing protein n=1 Tax=Pinibacter aurantiacus TaxID=2851599 RepID=A0A9E2S339_9BACT|nr:FecR family protein [Pinibacter aurantiacus]MBV4355718.1 FecR domain-containing protein [Pinibacter aurantiacus]
MKSQESILLLLKKINENQASQEELNELIEQLKSDEKSELTEQLEIMLNPYKENGRKPLTTSEIENMAKSIFTMDHVKEEEDEESKVLLVKRVSFMRTWWAAAAVFVLAVAGGAYLWNHGSKNERESAAVTKPVQDVAPGKNGAILTLADGSQVELDSSKGGVIATQNGAKVLLKNNQLVYDAQAAEKDKVVYNTVSTPRGRQYQITLPDGSKVWLNAASSIRYPNHFTGSERKVEITGEAYFDVAKDASAPFVVQAGNEDIQVLGTEFNVMSYDDEAYVKTTLVNGSVKVGVDYAARILKPGQQSQVAKNQSLQVKSDIDVDEVIAWKNGRFAFSEVSLETIMKQVARWYDVEVSFNDKIYDIYTMNISRNVPVSKLLQYMEMSGGVHFEIEGKKIIVRK